MKRVLLAVCGLTPQIITETLYALHCEGRLPQRVVVLTTRAGRERCLNTLFGGPGMLHRFFDDYGDEQYYHLESNDGDAQPSER